MFSNESTNGLFLHREMHEGSLEALIKLSIRAGFGTAEDFREVEG